MSSYFQDLAQVSLGRVNPYISVDPIDQGFGGMFNSAWNDSHIRYGTLANIGMSLNLAIRNNPDSWWGKATGWALPDYTDNDNDVIPEEEFNYLFGHLGLDYKSKMTYGKAYKMADIKHDESTHLGVLSRAKGHKHVYSFLGGLSAGLFDPANIALATASRGVLGGMRAGAVASSARLANGYNFSRHLQQHGVRTAIGDAAWNVAKPFLRKNRKLYNFTRPHTLSRFRARYGTEASDKALRRLRFGAELELLPAHVGLNALGGIAFEALNAPLNEYKQSHYTGLDSAFNVLFSTAIGSVLPYAPQRVQQGIMQAAVTSAALGAFPAVGAAWAGGYAGGALAGLGLFGGIRQPSGAAAQARRRTPVRAIFDFTNSFYKGAAPQTTNEIIQRNFLNLVTHGAARSNDVEVLKILESPEGISQLADALGNVYDQMQFGYRQLVHGSESINNGPADPSTPPSFAAFESREALIDFVLSNQAEVESIIKKIGAARLLDDGPPQNDFYHSIDPIVRKEVNAARNADDAKKNIQQQKDIATKNILDLREELNELRARAERVPTKEETNLMDSLEKQIDLARNNEKLLQKALDDFDSTLDNAPLTHFLASFIVAMKKDLGLVVKDRQGKLAISALEFDAFHYVRSDAFLKAFGDWISKNEGSVILKNPETGEPQHFYVVRTEEGVLLVDDPVVAMRTTQGEAGELAVPIIGEEQLAILKLEELPEVKQAVKDGIIPPEELINIIQDPTLWLNLDESVRSAIIKRGVMKSILKGSTINDAESIFNRLDPKERVRIEKRINLLKSFKARWDTVTDILGGSDEAFKLTPDQEKSIREIFAEIKDDALPADREITKEDFDEARQLVDNALLRLDALLRDLPRTQIKQFLVTRVIGQENTPFRRKETIRRPLTEAEDQVRREAIDNMKVEDYDSPEAFNEAVAEAQQKLQALQRDGIEESQMVTDPVGAQHFDAEDIRESDIAESIRQSGGVQFITQTKTVGAENESFSDLMPYRHNPDTLPASRTDAERIREGSKTSITKGGFRQIEGDNNHLKKPIGSMVSENAILSDVWAIFTSKDAPKTLAEARASLGRVGYDIFTELISAWSELRPISKEVYDLINLKVDNQKKEITRLEGYRDEWRSILTKAKGVQEKARNKSPDLWGAVQDYIFELQDILKATNEEIAVLEPRIRDIYEKINRHNNQKLGTDPNQEVPPTPAERAKLHGELVESNKRMKFLQTLTKTMAEQTRRLEETKDGFLFAPLSQTIGGLQHAVDTYNNLIKEQEVGLDTFSYLDSSRLSEEGDATAFWKGFLNRLGEYNFAEDLTSDNWRGQFFSGLDEILQIPTQESTIGPPKKGDVFAIKDADGTPVFVKIGDARKLDSTGDWTSIKVPKSLSDFLKSQVLKNNKVTIDTFADLIPEVQSILINAIKKEEGPIKKGEAPKYRIELEYEGQKYDPTDIDSAFLRNVMDKFEDVGKAYQRVEIPSKAGATLQEILAKKLNRPEEWMDVVWEAISSGSKEDLWRAILQDRLSFIALGLYLDSAQRWEGPTALNDDGKRVSIDPDEAIGTRANADEGYQPGAPRDTPLTWNEALVQAKSILSEANVKDENLNDVEPVDPYMEPNVDHLIDDLGRTSRESDDYDPTEQELMDGFQIERGGEESKNETAGKFEDDGTEGVQRDRPDVDYRHSVASGSVKPPYADWLPIDEGGRLEKPIGEAMDIAQYLYKKAKGANLNGEHNHFNYTPNDFVHAFLELTGWTTKELEFAQESVKVPVGPEMPVGDLVPATIKIIQKNQNFVREWANRNGVTEEYANQQPMRGWEVDVEPVGAKIIENPSASNLSEQGKNVVSQIRQALGRELRPQKKGAKKGKGLTKEQRLQQQIDNSKNNAAIDKAYNQADATIVMISRKQAKNLKLPDGIYAMHDGIVYRVNEETGKIGPARGPKSISTSTIKPAPELEDKVPTGQLTDTSLNKSLDYPAKRALKKSTFDNKPFYVIIGEWNYQSSYIDGLLARARVENPMLLGDLDNLKVPYHAAQYESDGLGSLIREGGAIDPEGTGSFRTPVAAEPVTGGYRWRSGKKGKNQAEYVAKIIQHKGVPKIVLMKFKGETYEFTRIIDYGDYRKISKSKEKIKNSDLEKMQDEGSSNMGLQHIKEGIDRQAATGRVTKVNKDLDALFDGFFAQSEDTSYMDIDEANQMADLNNMRRYIKEVAAKKKGLAITYGDKRSIRLFDEKDAFFHQHSVNRQRGMEEEGLRKRIEETVKEQVTRTLVETQSKVRQQELDDHNNDQQHDDPLITNVRGQQEASAPSTAEAEPSPNPTELTVEQLIAKYVITSKNQDGVGTITQKQGDLDTDSLRWSQSYGYKLEQFRSESDKISYILRINPDSLLSPQNAGQAGKLANYYAHFIELVEKDAVKRAEFENIEGGTRDDNLDRVSILRQRAEINSQLKVLDLFTGFFAQRSDNNLHTAIIEYLTGGELNERSSGSSVHAYKTAMGRKMLSLLTDPLKDRGAFDDFLSDKLRREIAEAIWKVSYNEDVSHLPPRAVQIAKIKIRADLESLALTTREGLEVVYDRGRAQATTHSPEFLMSGGRRNFGSDSQSSTVKKVVAGARALKNFKKLPFDEAQRRWSDFLINETKLNHRSTFGVLTTEGADWILDPASAFGQFFSNKMRQSGSPLRGADTLRYDPSQMWHKEFLNEIFSNIIESEGGESPFNVVDRETKRKTIVFADWDSELKYQEKYGSRGGAEGMLLDMQRRGQVLGIVARLGSDPDANFKMLMDLGGETIAKDKVLSGPIEGVQKHGLIWMEPQAYYDTVMGYLHTPDGNAAKTISGIGTALRQAGILAFYGFATISSTADLAVRNFILTTHGIKNVRKMVRDLRKLNSTKEGREVLAGLAVGAEAWLGTAAEKFGFSQHHKGFMGNMVRTMFKINGMNAWLRMNQNRSVAVMANNFGNHAEKSFVDLPEETKQLLHKYEIGEFEWDILRQGAYEVESSAVGKVKMLTVGSAKNIPVESIRQYAVEMGYGNSLEAVSKARKELDWTLNVLFSSEMDAASALPGPWEMANLYWGQPAGTLLGEAARFSSMAKGHGAFMHRKVYNRAFQHTQTTGSFIPVAQFISLAIAYGVIAGAATQILKGNVPLDEDQDDLTFFLKAFQLSGVGGMFTDMLTHQQIGDSESSFINSAGGTLLGPLWDTTRKLHDSFGAQTNRSQKLTENIFSLLPYSNLPGVEMASEALIWDNFNDMLEQRD